MKNWKIKVASLMIAALSLNACEEKAPTPNEEVVDTKDYTVPNFIWRGLNQFYFWQKDVPNLADNRFLSTTEKNAFFAKYPDNEAIFDALRMDSKIDKFSWMVDDYTQLEQSLGGTNLSDGMDFMLMYRDNTNSTIVGLVRYVLPNSDAEKKGVKRGDVFYGINGQELTLSNYQKLLSLENYTLNMGEITSGGLVNSSKTFALTKSVLTENPILINKVIERNGKKVGYLMYNGFYASADLDLNNAFGTLKQAGISELILDLRYNSGGSVTSATRLASMITGQYSNQIFAQQMWNDKMTKIFSDGNDLESLKNRFVDDINGTAINKLNLDKIYILTTRSTASASELIINGLKPYINVIQIGNNTIGKNVGSITLYDSPSLYSKTNINPKHKYAMQPLVLKIANSAGFSDYSANGLTPNYIVNEIYSNMGILGDENETYLNFALSKIFGTSAKKRSEKAIDLQMSNFTDVKMMNPYRSQMYVDMK